MDRRHAVRTYDRIADHFAKTRRTPWPEVESFVADAPGGAVGLDLGCGNGRHAEVLATRVECVLGADASRAILDVARDRLNESDAVGQFSLVQADAATLPVATGAVDLATYVATVHHLRERDRRIASLDELARTLAPDGRALVSAWSVTHDRFQREEGFDTTIDWTLPDGETVPRFYHVYDPEEFDRDLAESALDVRETFVSSGNCYARCGGSR